MRDCLAVRERKRIWEQQIKGLAITPGAQSTQGRVLPNLSSAGLGSRTCSRGYNLCSLKERSCSLTGNLPKEFVRNQPHGVPGRLFTERCFTRATLIQNYRQYTMQTTLQTRTARGHCCQTPCTATPECQGRRKPHRSLLWEKASTPAPGRKQNHFPLEHYSRALYSMKLQCPPRKKYI